MSTPIPATRAEMVAGVLDDIDRDVDAGLPLTYRERASRVLHALRQWRSPDSGPTREKAVNALAVALWGQPIGGDATLAAAFCVDALTEAGMPPTLVPSHQEQKELRDQLADRMLDILATQGLQENGQRRVHIDHAGYAALAVRLANVAVDQLAPVRQ